jgi:hypothetical protein
MKLPPRIRIRLIQSVDTGCSEWLHEHATLAGRAWCRCEHQERKQITSVDEAAENVGKLHYSQSKTDHDIAAARVRDARCSPVKEVQISLDDLQ